MTHVYIVINKKQNKKQQQKKNNNIFLNNICCDQHRRDNETDLPDTAKRHLCIRTKFDEPMVLTTVRPPKKNNMCASCFPTLPRFLPRS